MPPASTGSDVLDTILDGGLPRGRTTLLTGTPGTGKTTLGMQFLQAGLAAGESGLFVSTEQTTDELRDSFQGFEFDLGRDGLAVTSLHPAPGRNVESDDDLTLQSYGDDQLPGEEFGIPFEGEYVKRLLRRYSDADRVVFDSASALRPVADDENVYRRVMLDLVRLFSDEFDATTIFTAEGGDRPGVPALEYNLHGLVRVWREERGGEDHHFLKVEKMRGVAHDKRTFETEFNDAGVRVIPRLRTEPTTLTDRERMSTGVDGLDELTGGGFVSGGLNVIRTDGRATTSMLLTNVQREAVEAGATLTIVPPARLPMERLLASIDRHIDSHQRLLDDDRLVLLDMVSERDSIHENHVVYQRIDGDLVDVYGRIYDIAGDGSLVSTMHLLPIVEGASPDLARRARHWAQANRTSPDDLLLYQVNPGVVDDQLAEFYVDTAQCVVDTYVNEAGIQCVKLLKAPQGYLGSERVVEYSPDEPYVRVQSGPLGGGE